MDKSEKSKEELIGLFKEYETMIVLEQHDKISKLSSKIWTCLIELLDEELSEIDDDEKVREAAMRLSTSDFIQSLCNSIFLQGKIAMAYAEVREFVKIRVSIVGRSETCHVVYEYLSNLLKQYHHTYINAN